MKTLLVAALAALTLSVTATAGNPRAQKTCERVISGTYLVAGFDPVGLPTLYGCVGPAVDPTNSGAVKTFTRDCVHAGGVAMYFGFTLSDGEFYCYPPGFDEAE